MREWRKGRFCRSIQTWEKHCKAKTIYNRFTHLQRGTQFKWSFWWREGIPQQAYAWAVQQQWEPELGSIPPLVCTECRPWEHGTGPAACRGSQHVHAQKIVKTKVGHCHQSQWIMSSSTAYPCPPRATNISWNGNCLWRSFSMTSIHLGSPGSVSNSWQNTWRTLWNPFITN